MILTSGKWVPLYDFSPQLLSRNSQSCCRNRRKQFSALQSASESLDIAAESNSCGKERGGSVVLLNFRVMAVALPLVLASLSFVRQRGFGLAGIWWTLVIFFAFRAANSCGRIFMTSRRPGSYLHKGSQGLPSSAAA